MISKELVEKINSLWHKQKTVGLTDEEKMEQKAAREEYLAAIRTQVRGMLEELKKPVADHHDCQCHEKGCSCGSDCNHGGHHN